MTTQTIRAFYADDMTLVFTFTTNGSISGDTFEFVIVDDDDALVVRKTWVGGDITISDAGSSTTPGEVTVDLADDLEVGVDTYKWVLRRTNTGREKVAAEGVLPLRASYKTAT